MKFDVDLYALDEKSPSKKSLRASGLHVDPSELK